MTTFFEHQRTSYKRNYLKNLIKLASTDGKLDTAERALILNIGLKRGLKEWQINELLEADPATFGPVFIPESLNNRMNMFYDLMQIVFVDEQVSEHERNFMEQLVRDFRLEPSVIDEVNNLFKLGTPTADEWRSFVEFVQLENTL